jgi:cysteinyl-tRNA synthetase
MAWLVCLDIDSVTFIFRRQVNMHKKITLMTILCLTGYLTSSQLHAADETKPVAAITAAGCTDQVYVEPDTQFSLTLSLYPENEDGTDGDWWLVANASEQWYYYLYPQGWFASDFGSLAPAYQGPLTRLPKLTISDTELTGLDRTQGKVTFYFGVDTVRNGSIDLSAVFYNSVDVDFSTRESTDACSRLASAETWMYQIQDLNQNNATDILDATDYPLLVIEPGHNFTEYPYDTSSMVTSLKTDPADEQRILLAYIDIGQAEDYRDYWEADWIAPTATQQGQPEFLITVDPDGWSGNYPVAYWHEEWKEIWLGDQGIIARLAQLGFDGVYLDWVEAYDDDAVRAVAESEGINGELEMIRFIEEIGAAGRAVRDDFLVVPQNAPYLIDTAPARYVRAIDALAVEDTWFHGDGDVPWDHPRAGDLRERYDDDWSTSNRLSEYALYKKRGLPVFSVDYCIDLDNAANVYQAARAESLVPLVTRVPLSRLTETPPEMFP